MPITASQKLEVDDAIKALLSATSRNSKRRIADMFLELPDRVSWPEYYEVIPEPRCLHGIQADLAKNKYKDARDVFKDLELVFLNALYYNEEGSQIAKDAATLKVLLETEWKQRSSLPLPDPSPSAPSALKARAAASAAESSPAAKLPQPKAAAATRSQAQAAPASSSTAAQSPERQPSPDMEVDVGGTPEPEGAAMEMVRDGESDEIVRQLEKGLPRWEGFGDFGWMEEVSRERRVEIVQGIAEYKDANGVRLATSLEAVPEESSIPELPFNSPLSLALIQSRVHSDYYGSSKAFDTELSQLFLKARRWYESTTEAYGNVLVLQRLYHALTSAAPPSGPPYTSTTDFASLRAGPGTAKPLHSTDTEGVPGVTTYRVSTKDRTIVDEVQFKGWSIRLADWLHLSNPDDPSRPIIGQVFRCYVSDEPTKKGQPGVTVCWYYRPEQTFHPANRQFWEKEVFKTSHFADHPLEDVIEKIACQFTARHIRGRPRPPFWHPGWPLYVCDSRYNDRERLFVKIKNWNSCVPEEVRKSTEFMPIYPFERTVFPRRFASPFLGGRPPRAPGGIGDAIEKGEGEKVEGGGTGRKRPRRSATGIASAASAKQEQTDRIGPTKGLYVGTGAVQPAATASPYQYAQTVQVQYARQQTALRGMGDRSIVTAAGGASVVNTEKLPPEIARHFDRDPETNEVLWFAAPPVDIARTPAPQHSLAYLHFLAQKRKRNDSADVSTSKRQKVPPTVTETVSTMFKKFSEEWNES